MASQLPQLNVRLPQEVLEQLKALCEQEGRSQANMLTRLIMQAAKQTK